MKCKIFQKSENFYYEYVDPVGGEKHKKLCRCCKTLQEAKNYVNQLKFLPDQYLIKNIAADMYLPESDMILRLGQFGKKLTDKTISQKRKFIELIIKNFGNQKITDLRISDVSMFLIKHCADYSGSWKNQYLEALGSIYDETVWKCEKSVAKPKFQRFIRNSRKPGIFTTEELNMLFSKDCWENESDWLLFLCTFTLGLRIGEARALQAGQFNMKEHTVVIDGFCRDDCTRTDFCKKGSEEDTKLRVVIVQDFTYVSVLSYLNRRHLQGDDYLFTRNGKPVRREYADEVFQRAIDKAGIKRGNRKLVPHSLRYTYVTRMRRHTSAEEVRKLVGHTTTEMTDYYTKSTIPELTEAVQIALEPANKLFS